jgi:hypothetical protein
LAILLDVTSLDCYSWGQSHISDAAVQIRNDDILYRATSSVLQTSRTCLRELPVTKEALMSKAKKNVLQTVILVYLSRLVMYGVKSLSTEKAYHYDEGQKLVKNFLWNLKLN